MDKEDKFHNLNPEDPDILNGEFDFDDDFFNLEYNFTPPIDTNITLPIEKINRDFEPYKNLFKFAHLNARSIPKHIDEINDLVHEIKNDVLAVSKTWLFENSDYIALT